ncbi:porin [Larkinella soli]|uniref:porin n=1 Tax=Larkinella soli TaxID=1770527 RepID=UPI000FFC49AF|nr:porin [Larkinella soli]
MINQIRIGWAAAVLGFAGFSAPAQPADSTAAATGLRLTGYVEAYYAHDFTAPRTVRERPGFLYNHRRNREVNINLAFLKAAWSGNRTRAGLALQVGTYPQYNYASEQELVRNILEANAGVKLSRTRSLWLDAGIFGSHIGFESAVSKDCWTLTRSLLAENSPYYLAGLKLTYESADGRWTLLGSLVNGWQRVRIPEGFRGPALSTQVQFRPTKVLTLNWSSFLGSDRPDSLKQGRFFNNFYAVLQPGGRVGLQLGFDIGRDRKPVVRAGSEVRVDGGGVYVWFSPVAIVRLRTGEGGYLNGRVEYYDDRHGVIVGRTGTPNGFRTFGYSLGYDHTVLPNALLRVEGKIYDSRDPVFEGRHGLSRTSTALTTSLAVSF